MKESYKYLSRLWSAIKRHSRLSLEDMLDVKNNGGDTGIDGFVYDSDCIKFFNKNKALIEDYASFRAIEMGFDNVFQMADKFVRRDVLGAGIDGYKILMSWYILEEVANYLHPEK